jgi:nucleoside-diphosphate-sugar epimerase
MSLIIVTGSAGLIGSESVRFFCERGFTVVGIDNNMRQVFFGGKCLDTVESGYGAFTYTVKAILKEIFFEKVSR